VPFSYGLFAMVFVEINSLQGIGRSWTGFLLSLARICLAIPAAYLLLHVLRLPLFTAWLAIVAANALMAFVGLRWVRGSLRHLETQPQAWTPSPELEAIPEAPELEPEPALERGS
jgi:Na+-driven multidrug efflux pump